MLSAAAPQTQIQFYCTGKNPIWGDPPTLISDLLSRHLSGPNCLLSFAAHSLTGVRTAQSRIRVWRLPRGMGAKFGGFGRPRFFRREEGM